MAFVPDFPDANALPRIIAGVVERVLANLKHGLLVSVSARRFEALPHFLERHPRPARHPIDLAPVAGRIVQEVLAVNVLETDLLAVPRVIAHPRHAPPDNGLVA